MNPRANAAMFFILLILFGIAIGGAGYWLGERRVLPRLTFTSDLTPTSSQTRVGGAIATPSPIASASPTMIQEDPATVVDTFMKNFTQSAPPNDVNGGAPKTAFSLLSKDGQRIINQESASSLASGLARFAGVQSIPTDYTLGKPVVTDGTAVVATTWDYLSGSITKVFYLTLENNTWKIDTIRDK